MQPSNRFRALVLVREIEHAGSISRMWLELRNGYFSGGWQDFQGWCAEHGLVSSPVREPEDWQELVVVRARSTR